MIIKKISIKKFRGFNEEDFELGSHLTVIAGQNGTQKTTLLGILSQPFTITDKNNPIYSEKPLCGGNFKSAFSEKFKFSKKFDKAGVHEWTLHFSNGMKPFTVDSETASTPERLRFWQKGNKSVGSGYIQLPVIYLSLKRLFPFGEDKELKESKKIKLTTEEIEFYIKWHNKILSCQDEINKTNFLAGQHKETIGATTDYYDWKQNSAGQDNIGKILLAILSFKRLKEKYPGNYNGGILAIDELDTTLFPASQINLLDALRKFASKFNIQIIFTTHSLTLLENACDLQKKVERNGQVKVISLIKIKKKIKIEQDVTFPAIKHHLNITLDLPDAEKINVFTEDNETADFAKVLLKSKITRKLKFVNCSLSCSGLIDLSYRKFPSFIFPNAFIILDGDVKDKRLKKVKNILLLPGKNSPERLFAEFLYELDEESLIWENINRNFTKQYCFREIAYNEIMQGGNEGRTKAKEWYKSHKKVWGRNATKVINPWIKENKEKCDDFVNQFIKMYNKFAKELSLDEITITKK